MWSGFWANRWANNWIFSRAIKIVLVFRTLFDCLSFFSTRESNRDRDSSVILDTPVVKKQVTVSLRPTFWNTSSAGVECRVTDNKGKTCDDNNEDDTEAFLEPCSSAVQSETKSSTYSFPSFTNYYCPKLSDIDLFHSFPKRPPAIPVSMAEPCLQLPSTINGLPSTDFYDGSRESAEVKSIEKSSGEINSPNPVDATPTPTTQPSTSRGDHGWFRNVWEASISCITPLVAKWPMLSKQQAAGGKSFNLSA